MNARNAVITKVIYYTRIGGVSVIVRAGTKFRLMPGNIGEVAGDYITLDDSEFNLTETKETLDNGNQELCDADKPSIREDRDKKASVEIPQVP